MIKKKELLEIKVFWLPIVAEIFFEGKAQTVSSQNKMGKFDILARHTNFITLIFENLTIVTPKNKKISYQFERGVLEVSENKINIFLGI